MRLDPPRIPLPPGPPRRDRRAERGSLFMMVLIVLMVVSTVALAVLLVWIRHHRLTARDAENAILAGFATALRASIIDTGVIPAPNGFAQAIRTRLPQPDSQILENQAGHARAFLVDPGLGLGPSTYATLPFVQAQTGTMAPQSPRILIVSSMGAALPAGLTTGAALTATEFNALWNVPFGQMPAGWSWDGDPRDLCIERLHLGDLFVSITLRYHSPQPQHRGRYLVASDPQTASSPAELPDTPFTSFFLRGTYLCLYGPNGALQFREILQESGLLYTCQDGVWRIGTGTRGTRIGPTIRHPTIEEFEDAMEAFLDDKVPLWTNNSTVSKEALYSAITNFLAHGAYNNQGAGMPAAQTDLINKWAAFTGAQPNKP